MPHLTAANRVAYWTAVGLIWSLAAWHAWEARALFGDDSLVPVRGQLARGIPDADVRYGLFYKNVGFVPRRDGLVFQVTGDNDYYGYGDDTEVPDRAEAERAVNTIASLFTGAAG